MCVHVYEVNILGLTDLRNINLSPTDSRLILIVDNEQGISYSTYCITIKSRKDVISKCDIIIWAECRSMV